LNIININFEHDITNPVVSLTSPSSPSSSSNINPVLIGTVSNTSTISGTPTLIIHRDSSGCNNSISNNVYSSFTSSGYTATATNLSNSKFWGLATDSAGNSVCTLLLDYNHVLGSLSNSTSTWVIQKKTVSNVTPENNNITFNAKDENNNPLTGISVTAELQDERVVGTVSSVNLPLTEISSGVYRGTTNLTYDYQVSILSGSIPTYSPRDISIVYATSTPYCFLNGRETLSSYDELGSGTISYPYQICHAKQLKDLSNNCSTTISTSCNKNYILMNNIDLAEWYPRGTVSDQEFILAEDSSNRFQGVFNGNNLFIKNYKYTQDASSFKGMFGYGSSVTVNNLTYDYSYSSLNTSNIGGLFYDISNSSVLSSLDVTGTVSSGVGSNIGGVVYSATTSGEWSSIKTSLTTDNIGSGGALGYSINGLSASIPLEISRVYSLISTSDNNPNIVINIGGLIGQSNFVNISDSYSENNINLDTVAQGTVGGVVGYLNNGLIDRVYSKGDLNISGSGINESGGLVGINDGSSISDSFSLLDTVTTDCTVKCGKVVGDSYNIVSVVFSNLYTSNQAVLSLGLGSGNESVSETSVDLVSTPNYFFSSVNAPIDNFDFINIWNEYPSKLPELK
jgi:hypothetical protein